MTLKRIPPAVTRLSRSWCRKSVRLHLGLILVPRNVAADWSDLELNEARLSLCIRCGKGVHAPIGRADKTPGRWTRSDIVCLMQRFGIGDGKCLDFPQNPAFRPVPELRAWRNASIWSSVLA